MSSSSNSSAEMPEEVPENLQQILDLNVLHRTNAAIGPDVQARQVIYFVPQSGTERAQHPYTYRMRAHYHPIDHIPRESQTWSVHMRVHRPYNLAIYVVEDLNPQRGAYPLLRSPPPPHLRSMTPDTGPRKENAPQVHYFNQLGSLRPDSPPKRYVVHVPRLVDGEGNRTYRFFLYPYVEEVWKCRDSPDSWRYQQWVGPRGLLHEHHPRLPRGMVVAPQSAGATVAHLDGYLVHPQIQTWTNVYGLVADWTDGCVRAGADGFDGGYVEEPVDESDSDDDDFGVPTLEEEYRKLSVDDEDDEEDYQSAAEE